VKRITGSLRDRSPYRLDWVPEYRSGIGLLMSPHQQSCERLDKHRELYYIVRSQQRENVETIRCPQTLEETKFNIYNAVS